MVIAFILVKLDFCNIFYKLEIFIRCILLLYICHYIFQCCKFDLTILCYSVVYIIIILITFFFNRSKPAMIDNFLNLSSLSLYEIQYQGPTYS